MEAVENICLPLFIFHIYFYKSFSFTLFSESKSVRFLVLLSLYNSPVTQKFKLHFIQFLNQNIFGKVFVGDCLLFEKQEWEIISVKHCR